MDSNDNDEWADDVVGGDPLVRRADLSPSDIPLPLRVATGTGLALGAVVVTLMVLACVLLPCVLGN